MKKSIQVGIILSIIYFGLAPYVQAQCGGMGSSTAPKYQTKTSGSSNTGDFSDPADWNAQNAVGGVLPTTGGNPPYGVVGGSITIPAGDIVEIANNFQLNYNLIVNGTLLVSGFIQMGDPGNSSSLTITVGSGGRVTCCSDTYCNGGTIPCASCGASDKVKIGSAQAWCGTVCGASQGPFDGPITLSSGGLPITLASFAANSHLNSVDLKWSTTTEINFDHFVLEKSSNGSQFIELAQIQGSGNSNTRKDYSYTDNHPFVGNSYYRLTSIDFDGYTEVFNNNVVRVTVKAEKNFSITQNPIQSFHLKGLVNFESEHGSVTIFDRMGSVIAKYAIGDSEIDVQLPTLSSGVYFAQFQSGEFSKTVRFAVNEQ